MKSMLNTTLSKLALAAALSVQRNIFFAGFDQVDAQRRANPGRLKQGQGDKYSGALIRKLTAERGCGCPYNKRRRAAQKIGGGA